ncbi:MAG TPA: response regulator transcription factor [Candidatus Acidoferrales bacterium]|nr:response regulator transcription factor [Candidatus Acidoferrales bacterium]
MPARPVKILVVDDEPAMRRALRASLTASGYLVEEARDGEQAIAMVQRQPIDVVLLDIHMPGIGGLETCRRIRPLAPQAGIIMITVTDHVDQKVQTLEAGADDYVTKPFLFRELLARLHALLRRTGSGLSPTAPVLRAGELELDIKRRILKKAGAEVHLSPTEFDLLSILMQNQGTPIEHSRLLRAIWGPEYGAELEYLRTYIRLLRKKIETNPANPEYILTEPWVGYRFRDPSSTEVTDTNGTDTAAADTYAKPA